jgi:SAM-dependent methyltransferase
MSQLTTDEWQPMIQPVIDRFNREFERQEFDLPDEVQAMPIFQDWVAGTLQTKTNSPFWELVKPQKKQNCLDIGCGFSFLIYPWREWEANFYGQEVSLVAAAAIKSRGPQLNSKLFKDMQIGAAHHLKYEADQFDLAIATGFSCYYSLEYWSLVLAEVKRVLKPGGSFVMDVLDPDTDLAENWAILETYLGAEVSLEPLSAWQDCVAAAGGKVTKRANRDLFQMWQITFA